jgi:hypothetical protein
MKQNRQHGYGTMHTKAKAPTCSSVMSVAVQTPTDKRGSITPKRLGQGVYAPLSPLVYGWGESVRKAGYMTALMLLTPHPPLACSSALSGFKPRAGA